MADKSKDWWTIKRKRRLLKFAKSLTVVQISKKMHRTIEEIDAMLIKLVPEHPRIRHRYREHGVIVTVYSSGHAYGSNEGKIAKPSYRPVGYDCYV